MAVPELRDALMPVGPGAGGTVPWFARPEHNFELRPDGWRFPARFVVFFEGSQDEGRHLQLN